MLDLAFLSTSDYSGSKLNYVTQCPKFQRPYFLSFFLFLLLRDKLKITVLYPGLC